MEVEISTSDPEAVDPKEVAKWLELKGYFVASVNVNDGQRVWEAE